jgi:L-lactate dehydrogenase
VGTVPVQDFSMPGGNRLDGAAQDRIAREVVTAAERIIRGKGATNYAVGLAATRVIEAILRDENSVQPVSSLVDDRYGINDVCLSLPSIVNRGGVATMLDVPMSDKEIGLLQGSAREVRAVAASLGL